MVTSPKALRSNRKIFPLFSKNFSKNFSKIFSNFSISEIEKFFLDKVNRLAKMNREIFF